VKHELFPLDQLPPGKARAATIGNIGIVVMRTPEGDVYAMRDICPHQGAKLSKGWVERTVGGDDVGEYALLDGYVIRCPWHGHEFDKIGRASCRERV